MTPDGIQRGRVEFTRLQRGDSSDAGGEFGAYVVDIVKVVPASEWNKGHKRYRINQPVNLTPRQKLWTATTSLAD